MKRFHLISFGLLAIFLGACLVVVASAQDEQQPDDGHKGSQIVPSARSLFVMPKFFDFKLYMQMFNKHYQSLVQELARQKLFMAKAFKAFISGIQYIYRKAEYYYSINQLSDQTPEELAKRINGRKSGKGEQVGGSEGENADGELGQIEAADRADVERELKSIVEGQNDEPGLKEMAEQISKASGLRRRRNADPRRDLSLDQLVRPTVRLSKSDKMVNYVSSNNPHYEPVELMSFGTDPEQADPAIPDDKVSYINSLPGASYVSAMRNRLVAAFNWRNEDASSKLNSRGLKNVDDLDDVIHVDLRKTKCFVEPRDQGNCGSCYIFSTMALLEWAHCMQTGKLVTFSEQYAVDCGFRMGLEGCNGGYEKDVVGFVRRYGLELHKNYPYKAFEGTCPYPRNTDPKVMGYVKVKEAKLRNVRTFHRIEKTLRDYPLLATVNVPFDFSSYGGGVHPGDKCNEKDGTHAMLLIGYGRQDGHEYWLFRNSYAATWGEGGHFKLNKESSCFLPEESLTLASGIDDFANKNRLYKSFRLTKKHDQRDPDAPNYTDPVAGPVNSG